MTGKVTNIEIQNFRGIRTFLLPLSHADKPLNAVIFGENGAGKSSIIDALEFYFSGSIEQLRHRQDVRERECIPNLNGGVTQVKVKLTGFSGTTLAEYPTETITFLPADEAADPESYPRHQVEHQALQAFFREAVSRPFILRRAQLLRFINAKPADRYSQISQLIGLEELDRIEDAWRKVRNDEKLKFQRTQRDHDNDLTDLKRHLETDADANADLLQALNAKLATFELDPVQTVAELSDRQRTLGEQAIDETRIIQAHQLTDLAEQSRAIRAAFDSLLAAHQSLGDSRVQFVQVAERATDSDFEPLLTTAQKLIDKRASLAICPLCEQDISDEEAFRTRFNDRLTALRELTSSRQKLEKQRTLVSRSLDGLVQKIDNFRSEGHAHFTATQLETLDRTGQLVTGWQQQLSSNANWTDCEANWQTTLAETNVIDELATLETGLKDSAKALMPTEVEQELVNQVSWLTRVDEKWRAWQEGAVELDRAEKICRQVDLTYGAFVKAQKRGAERILKQVESTFKSYYDLLHPGEGYGAITLPPVGGSSRFNLKTEFHGLKTDHPLGYFSEGHLDSLGLCIFLAFIRQFNSYVKLIILDDVLTSVDAGHRMRVAQLLAREFKDYQLIITTHDEMWAQQLGMVMKNAGVTPKMIRLKPWSLEDGADWDDFTGSNWGYYRQQINDGQCQSAIANTGRDLEKFLFQMRRNLRLAVPATPDDRYTLGDLYDPFFKWTRKYPLTRPDLPDYQEVIARLEAELDDYWRLRNWSGAHYNEWGSRVSQTEATAFVEIVRELVQLFECPACGELVRYDHNSKMVHCPNCVSRPQPRVIWQFKPGWKASVDRLLIGLVGKPESSRKNAVKATQSAFEKFLQDTRYRFGLAIPATPDDVYTVKQLSSPFFDWAEAHPNPAVENWSVLLELKAKLDQFLDDGRWVELTTIADAAETFVATVDAITQLFMCEAGHPLNFDAETHQYICTTCTATEPVTGTPARWFITGS